MNDDKLAALFRDAAATPPEAGFGYLDVTRASQRITTRRRVVASGMAAVLVAVAGTGVVVAASRDQGTLTSAAGAPAAAPEANSPLVAGSGADRAAAAAPLGPSSAECVDKYDPALRAIVEQVLPEIAGATDAATTQECELGGGRQVNVEVTDAGVAGLLNVTYEPSGVLLHPVDGAITAPTASGGTVAVSSRAMGPSGGRAPFADRLRAVLQYLAPRL